jgi:hypothetical protein
VRAVHVHLTSAGLRHGLECDSHMPWTWSSYTMVALLLTSTFGEGHPPFDSAEFSFYPKESLTPDGEQELGRARGALL